MVKYFFITVLVLSLMVSCTAEKKDLVTEDKVNDELPVIQLDDFEKEAPNYVGKEVKVVGLIDHACKHGGKRLFMVSDNADLHIDGEERFDEDLIGKEIIAHGIVSEFRVDEAYCLKIEEDNIQKHKNGETDESFFEQKQNQIDEYRQEMKEKGVDHLSFYSLDYISHKVKK